MTQQVTLKAEFRVRVPFMRDKRVFVKADGDSARSLIDSLQWARAIRELNPEIAPTLSVTRTTVEVL